MAGPESKNIFVRSGMYVKSCFDELRYKVSWPTPRELTQSAAIVFVASVILSLLIFGVDQILEYAMSGLYRLII